VIALDVNILIFGYDVSSHHHGVIRPWLEDVLNRKDVGLPISTLWGFLRLSTSETISVTPRSGRGLSPDSRTTCFTAKALHSACSTKSLPLDRESSHTLGHAQREEIPRSVEEALLQTEW
jgi:hypothetical protein